VLSFGYWTTDFLVVRAPLLKDLRSARMTPVTASFFRWRCPSSSWSRAWSHYRLVNLPGSEFKLLPHRVTGEPWNDTALPLLIRPLLHPPAWWAWASPRCSPASWPGRPATSAP
jgi:SSS family solute:Na+ symporter